MGVTPVGRVLRKLKLDELPQLVNVLRGDMSMLDHGLKTPVLCANFNTREQLRVLSRRRADGAFASARFSRHQFHRASERRSDGILSDGAAPARLAEDLEYVDQMSLGLDLKVIAQTAYCVLVKTWL